MSTTRCLESSEYSWRTSNTIQRTYHLLARELETGMANASDKTIGIQVGAVSFVDEGVEQALDILQKHGGVNTLFLAVFTYGRGIAGRQVPGQPLPDHGKQEYDLNFHGGNFATVHPQYYKDTAIKPRGHQGAGSRRPRHHRQGVPEAKRRGMKHHPLGGGCVAYRYTEYREATASRPARAEDEQAVLQQPISQELSGRIGRGLHQVL